MTKRNLVLLLCMFVSQTLHAADAELRVGSATRAFALSDLQSVAFDRAGVMTLCLGASQRDWLTKQLADGSEGYVSIWFDGNEIADRSAETVLPEGCFPLFSATFPPLTEQALARAAAFAKIAP